MTPAEAFADPRLARAIGKAADAVLARGVPGVLRADLVQEGWLAAFRALPRYDPARARLSTWLYPRAYWAMVDYLRELDPLGRLDRRRVKAGAAADVAVVSLEARAEYGADRREPAPDRGDPWAEDYEPRLRGLPARHKEAARLYARDGLRMREVGAVLGVGEARVSQILQEVKDHVARFQEVSDEGV